MFAEIGYSITPQHQRPPPSTLQCPTLAPYVPASLGNRCGTVLTHFCSQSTDIRFNFSDGTIGFRVRYLQMNHDLRGLVI